ncbi:hypothetical protein IJG76_00890 [Candidatus Saccharibacteria bacterium]|nr:hypothetical protein [Candidatus Saccharibacteria bacterium]MBR0061562.1 hypothetical protein [Selenomonadaceae bacterium]
MLALSLFRWWYLDGFRISAQKSLERLKNTYDFFSIGQLMRTFFSPFRQVSALSAHPTFFEKLLDKLVSRLVGAAVRFFIILLGLLALIFQSVFSLALILLWPVLPLLPIVCLILGVKGGF